MGVKMEENEIIEVTPEETIQEEVVPEATEEQKTEELNDLLIEYIKSQMEEETEEIETEEETTKNEDLEETLPEETYNPQIGEILEELRSSESNLEYQSILLDETRDNNLLTSNMTDISLTNTLLILIYMSILLSALLNFSRRIF